MRSLILSAVAAVTFAFVGSAAQAERLTEKPLVDANWVADNLDNPSMVVVDIRSLTKDGNPYDAGHIPGAVYAPYGKFGWRAKVDDVVGMLPTVCRGGIHHCRPARVPDPPARLAQSGNPGFICARICPLSEQSSPLKGLSSVRCGAHCPVLSSIKTKK